MEVTFKKAQQVGTHSFKEGKRKVPEHLFGSKKFQELVRLGHVYVHPRDAVAQTALNAKNEMNATKAQNAKRATKLMADAKAANAKHSEVTELLVPGTQQRIIKRREERALLAALLKKA